MIKAKQVNKAINWIAGAAAVYFAGITVAGYIKRKRNGGKVEGIGAFGVGIITLFDNYDSYKYFDEYKQMLMEANDLDDISDQEVYEVMGEQELETWEECKSILDRTFDDRSVIIKGNAGTWRGTREAMNVYDNIQKALQSICKDCDYIKIWQDNSRHLFIRASHHDGTHEFEIKAVTYDGERYLENWNYEYSAQTKHLGLYDIYERIWNSSKYSKLLSKIEW